MWHYGKESAPKLIFNVEFTAGIFGRKDYFLTAPFLDGNVWYFDNMNPLREHVKFIGYYGLCVYYNDFLLTLDYKFKKQYEIVHLYAPTIPVSYGLREGNRTDVAFNIPLTITPTFINDIMGKKFVWSITSENNTQQVPHKKFLRTIETILLQKFQKKFLPKVEQVVRNSR